LIKCKIIKVIKINFPNKLIVFHLRKFYYNKNIFSKVIKIIFPNNLKHRMLFQCKKQTKSKNNETLLSTMHEYRKE